MIYNQKSKPGQPVTQSPISGPQFSRRGIIGAAVAGFGCAALPQAAHAAISAAEADKKTFIFDVLKDGARVGAHKLSITRQDTKMLVDVRVRVKVKVGFLTAFEYDHTDHEVWEGQRLVSLNAQTFNNGKKDFVTARPGEMGLIISSSSGEFLAPEDVMSSSYWQFDTVRQNSLLNTQTGQLTDIRVDDRGRENLSFHGYDIPARHFRLEGQKMHCDVWYGAGNGQWLGLAFTTHGSRITYIPREETAISAL